MEVRLLGPLEVRCQGRAVEVAGRRLRLLVAVLALQAGSLVETERLVDLLWDQAALPADPVNALQALVSRLRRALESGGAGERLVSRPPGYLLAVEPDQVDALRFERLAAGGHAALAAGRPREAAAALRRARELWRGPALADFAGEPFAAANATRLSELRLGAVEDRIEAELALGEHARLVGELEPLVAEHPLRERLHALLMRALYAAGRQAEALAAYQRARQVLAEQAGLDPGPELRRVERAILAQDPALSAPAPLAPAPEPAAPPARRGRTNLRAPLTSFVGRKEELARVLELLDGGRLVTLTGPGGVGKTRLAVEAARSASASDGPWVVELARLRDGRLVPLTVLDALGLVEERPRLAAPAAQADAEDQLLAALRGRRVLLVLDNCEHLAEPVATLVEALLAGCPGVRVLATSREPLRVPGEVRWPVPALPVPPGPVEPERLAEFAGTRLFLERAAAAVPGFAVHTHAEASAVAEVCRRLDGLPLAIELAAARAGALPPRELAARLDDRFRLLTAGARTALPRQQTLRAVVDWSWDLLDRSERAALRRLGVLMGGLTLEAAEAVCAGPELETAEVAGTISSLVDRSLVTVTPAATLPPLWWPGIEAMELPPPPDAGGGEPRYGLLETVRAYALERLAEAGETDRVARAHAEWCVRLAEAAEPELRGHDQLVWIERISAELDNLRAALRWLLDHGEAALAVRLMAGMSGFLLLNGHREEAARSLTAALALPGPTPDRARGQALLAMAWADPDGAGTERSRRRLAEARAALERAALSDAEAALARVMSTIPEIVGEGSEQAERTIDGALEEVERIGGWPAALIRLMRGFAHASWSDRAGMREDGEVALERFRALGDRWGSVQSLELLSAVDMMEGRYGPASQRLLQALRDAWDLRMAPEVAVQLCRLAHLAVLQDDLDLAQARLEQALAAALELGADTEKAIALAGLALVAQRRGDVPHARLWREQATALARSRLDRHPMGFVLLAWLGTVAEQQGDLDGATAMFNGVLDQGRAHRSAGLFALGLDGLAGVACARGDAELAATLLGSAAAARRAVAVPLSPRERADIDRITRSARRALGEDAFARAFTRGEKLPPEDAAALAAKP